MGCLKRNSAIENVPQSADSDHPAHAQSIIHASALDSYILQYPMILLADSEGPDQTARMRSLIWAFAVRISPMTSFSQGAAYIVCSHIRLISIETSHY